MKEITLIKYLLYILWSLILRSQLSIAEVGFPPSQARGGEINVI